MLTRLGRERRLLCRGLVSRGPDAGIAGAATLVPEAAVAAGAVLGRGFIGWFAWIGGVLLRNRC